MDKFYLVKSTPSLANETDELIFRGFDLLDENEYQQATNKFKELGKWNEILNGYRYGYSMEFYAPAQYVLDDLECAKEIDANEYNSLLNNFGKHYGDTYYEWWAYFENKKDEE